MRRCLHAACLVAVLAISPKRARADDVASPPAHRRIGAKFEGGADVRSLFTLPIIGGRVDAAIGVLPREPRPARPEFYCGLGYGYGATEFGLPVHTVRAGVQAEWALGILRPSLGLGFLWLGIERASGSSGMVQHWGLSAAVGMTVDLARFGRDDHSGVFVGPRIGIDIFPHKLVPRTLSPWGALEVGLRY